MSSKKPAGYTLAPSNAYMMTCLVLVLIINLLLYVISYFFVNPYIESLVDPALWSKIFWGTFIGITFFFFALTYIIINAHRYWVDTDYIEKINVYFPKHKKRINWTDISYIKLRLFPVISNAFNFGTLIFVQTNDKGKERVIAKFLGIKYAKDVYLELINYLEPEKRDKKKTLEQLLL